MCETDSSHKSFSCISVTLHCTIIDNNYFFEIFGEFLAIFLS